MTGPEDRGDGLTRKQLLQSGAGAAASVLLAQGAGLERALAAMGPKGRSVAGMNVILFITCLLYTSDAADE